MAGPVFGMGGVSLNYGGKPFFDTILAIYPLTRLS